MKKATSKASIIVNYPLPIIPQDPEVAPEIELNTAGRWGQMLSFPREESNKSILKCTQNIGTM